MKSLLALDPGINYSGVAVFRNGKLVAAAAIPNPAPKGADILVRVFLMTQAITDYVAQYKPVPTSLAVEWPQIYGDNSKGDPNDLPHLAAIAGGVALLVGGHANRISKGADLRSYLPREWKGQMTKEACHARADRRLDHKEYAVWERLVGKGDLDAKDAVALGLHALDRLTPFKVLSGATEDVSEG